MCALDGENVCVLMYRRSPDERLDVNFIYSPRPTEHLVGPTIGSDPQPMFGSPSDSHTQLHSSGIYIGIGAN